MKRYVVVLASVMIGVAGCNEPAPPPRANPLGGMKPATGLQGPDGRTWRPEKNPVQTSGEVLPPGMTRNLDGSIGFQGSTYRQK